MALIYLVEDDDGIGEIESFALKNAGHEVALLTSVSAFWKACKKKITGFDCDGCDVTGCRWFSYRERNP